MNELFNNLSQDQANTCGLILTSSGIIYHVRRGEGGWDILVEDHDLAKAIQTINQYFEENRDAPSIPVMSREGWKWGLPGGVAAFFLILSHIFVMMNDKSDFIQAFGASADHMVKGEVYRSVTSLFLHSNGLHLLSNGVCIVIFAGAVCRVMGWGVGGFAILFSGALGNFLNALLHKTGHVSIGASTAVFGAIGILSGYGFLEKLWITGRRVKSWAPLAAGIALLGFLGAGENSDLIAHLMGFLSGTMIGVLYAYLIKQPLTGKTQFCFLIATACIILISLIKGAKAYLEI